jgi:large subunit ribosomal protein L29
MDITSVRGLTDAELVSELTTAKRHLYDLRFQLATRQLTDYSQIPQTRRTIARILAVLTERELSETGQPVASAARAGR